MPENDLSFKIFDTFLDSILVVNKDGNIRYCNNALSTLLNIPLKRIKFDSSLLTYANFSPALYKLTPTDNLAHNNVPTSYRELDFTSKGSRKGKVQVSIQPLPLPLSTGSESLWIIYIKDVTLEATLHTKYRHELDKKERAILRLQEAQKRLKEYSQTLETKVKQRTADLDYRNQMLSSMMNSLGQAFLLVDKDGVCSKTYSRITLKLLETDPSLKSIAQVLKIKPDQLESFKNWLRLLFEERLPFEKLAPLGPKLFPHSQGLHVALEFHPLREIGKTLTGLVVVATDRTGEIQALRQAEQEQTLAKRVVKLARFKDLFWNFVMSAEVTFERLRAFFRNPEAINENVEDILRTAHTLKGESNLFWISTVVRDVHEFETTMKHLLSQPKTVWPAIISKALEEITKAEKDLEDFLKENANIVGDRGQSLKSVEVPYKKLQNFFSELQGQNSLASQFANEFLKEPIGKFIKQYDDLAESIAQNLGKSINPIKLKGQDIRIFVDDYREVLNTLVHLITNSVVHGIEIPEVRTQREKPAVGTISVEISETPQELRILVQDDGQGVDPVQIREKLARLGLTTHENEPDTKIIQHIFDAGFSTKEDISYDSGRGIGLSALSKAVKNMGGSIEVRSVPEEGAQFIIILPLKTYAQAA